MTRDLKVWNVLMVVGLILGTLLVMPTDLLVSDYGIPRGLIPYMRLTSLILTALGKLGNSPLPGEHDLR